MTSTEWSQVDPSIQALAPHASEELFGGDFLGDELMDIYNAAVVGGGDENDDDLSKEMSSLLDTPTDAKKPEAIDDGFGAFRPSTSFNNLSTALLDPNPESATLSIVPTVEPSNDVPPGSVSTRVISSSSLEHSLVISPPQPLVAPTSSMVTYVTTPGGTKRKKTVAANAGPDLKRKSVSGSKQKKNVQKGAATKKVTKKTSCNPRKVTISSPDLATTSVVPRTTVLAPTKPISPSVSVHAPAASIKQESGPIATSAQSNSASQSKASAAPQAVSSSAPVAAPAASVLSNPPTEADFKSVAQAAVNNLIMNAGSNNTATKSKNEKTTETRPNSVPVPSATSIPVVTPTIRVDTSTEHVKALTGSNWVAVCGGGITSTDSNNQNNSDKLNRARRSNLTPDERARQNRDRNREHARNTRLRKKAYVEELKATLSALVTQRDAAELEKRHASQRELEQREVRFRVLEEFLKLRGRNEANAARWAAILEENFTLTMPFVNFRDMVHSNDGSPRYEQVLTGVGEVMNDSTLFSNFLQNFCKLGNNERITCVYNCDRSNFFMDNCVAMMDWTAATHGVSGQRVELLLKGQIRAKFSPASNKLISVIMSFDTGAINSQLNLIAQAKQSSEADAAAAAAQVAANEADALLDSLEMPHFEPPNSGFISSRSNVVPPSSGSSASSNDDKAVISSDDE